MSWFDRAGIANFAKSALNSAQKTLDKALEIKDEDLLNSPVTPDVDSFFEAFGLGAMSPGIESRPIPKEQPTSSHSSDAKSSTAYNSGFWTETWGSFFDTKSSPKTDVKTQASSSPSSESLSNTANQTTSKAESTVSCQPQRSSLFPGSVKQSTSEAAKSSEPVSNDGSDQQAENMSDSSTSTVDYEPPKLTVESSECNLGSLNTASSDVVSNNDKGKSDQTEDTCDNDVQFSSSIDTQNSNSKGDSGADATVKPNCDIVPTEYDIIDIGSPSTPVNTEIVEPTQSSSLVESSATEKKCTPISESFVDLEEHVIDVNKGIGSELSEEDEEPTTLMPTLEFKSAEEINYSDSFHILSDSIVKDVGQWVAQENPEEVHDSSPAESVEDHHSGNGDTHSSSSSKDESEADGRSDAKSTGSRSSHDMGNSFVKCTVDDVDNNYLRGQSPLSTTTSERSDITKLESEQNTSGDENETTTSSDIEILSVAACDNGDRNISPLKHMWVPTTLRVRRAESPSPESVKGGVLHVRESKERSSKGRSLAAEYKASQSSNRQLEGIDMQKFFEQQEELQALLEAREKKILELSEENVKLHEREEQLQNDLTKLKVIQENDSRSLSAITREFTQKFSQMEKQIQKSAREKTELLQKLDEVHVEEVRRLTIEEMEEIIKDRDEQVKELMQEGEKLSKKELQHTTIIKKLRTKESELEKSINSLRGQLEEASKEVDRLRISMGAKDDQEKKHIDAIRQLTSAVTKQEKEIATLKSNLEDATEKELSLKKSLDSTYRELTELRKASAVKDDEIQVLSLSVETAASQKLRDGLDKANKEASREKEVILMQLDDLRLNLRKNEEESNRREATLKDDISRLQVRLQESEARNEELTKSISSASRPLVRQIENLHTSYSAQITTLEKVEKNLTDRLNDAQNQVSICSEKERLATEKYLELSSKIIKLETQAATLRHEKIQLLSEIDVQKSNLVLLEEGKNRMSSSLESIKNKLTSEINKLKEEKESISSELKYTIELLKEERLHIQSLQEELRLKESRLHLNDNRSHSPSPSASVRSSVDSVNNWMQDEVIERRQPSSVSNYRVSVYDSLRTECAASVLENLQSQLKQREGEISQLQCEIAKLERERESLAQELVELTTQNEELQEKTLRLQNIENEHKVLDQKYNTLLQMFGEKVEQNEELLLDLADVKLMYKTQIEELLRNK